tara:strand:- start:438 stop:1094 length:657 start_codon:yes stop_codon:yes gene_type:complete
VLKLNIFKNSKPVIAIDGTAGSGKGTLANNLSKKLDFDHLDTGLLYRIYAFESIDEGNRKQLTKINFNEWLTNNEKLDCLRSEKISKLASQISQSTEVRESLVNYQRNFANNPPKGRGSIIDGRDIGTVIIPNAEVKFFIDADVEIRASRRNQQLKLGSLEYSNTCENMRKRDFLDSQRDISPLMPAVDSFKIDTSEMNETQVLEIALKYIRKITDFI